MQHVLPKDYSGETWVEAADRRAEEEQRRREGRFQPVLEKWPASMQHARYAPQPHVPVLKLP